jgi:hypothetical protein
VDRQPPAFAQSDRRWNRAQFFAVIPRKAGMTACRVRLKVGRCDCPALSRGQTSRDHDEKREGRGGGLSCTLANEERPTRRTRRNSGGHGGETRLTLHLALLRVPTHKLRALRVNTCGRIDSVAFDCITGWQTRGWSAPRLRRGRLRSTMTVERDVVMPDTVGRVNSAASARCRRRGRSKWSRRGGRARGGGLGW